MRGERGQAGIETVVALPLLLLALLAAAEAAAWAGASVLASTAAGAGARALARGEPPEAAARRELPGPFRGLARVASEQGVVRVSIRMPSLVPGVPGLSVIATARP